MGCISWLHLSDWHQSGVDFDRTVLRDKLLADIRDRSQIDPRLQSIDFVVFSGDASHRGTKAELEAIRDQLFAPLLKALDLPPDRLFLVPGNHDMDRGAHDLLPSGLRSPLTKDADVQKWLGDPERLGHVLRPFRAYTDFVTEYTGQPDPAYASVQRWTLEGRSVALLGLNSAWMCARNTVDGQVHDQGHLVIGEPQIHDALATIADADLRIVVMHHAFEWLAEFDRARVESPLKSAADIILWGHEHSPKVRMEQGTEGNCLIVPGGASFERREAEQPRYTNAYNFGYVNTDTCKGKIYLRRWFEQRRCWDKDTLTTQNGHFAFMLEKRPGASAGRSRTRPGAKAKASVSGATAERENKSAPASVASLPPSPRTNDPRFQMLKEAVAEALAASSTTMTALESVIGNAAQASGAAPSPPADRAARIRDAILEAPHFDQATSWLTAAYDTIRKHHRGDAGALTAITTVSSWLLPWLYIVARNVDCGPWQNVEIGTVLPLPAGLPTLAEIIMAGIEIRAALYKKKKSSVDWETSPFGLEMILPERGITPLNLNAIRKDLGSRLGIPPKIARKSDTPENNRIKDESIREQIRNLMNVENIRSYIICQDPDCEDECDEHRKFLSQISSIYPELGVIELIGDPLADQRLFNRIRDLFNKVD